MPTLPIADKTTLDAVKTKVDSLVSGVDWRTKTFQTSSPTATHLANTHLNITGSGYIVGLCAPEGTLFTIQIDGGTIRYAREGNLLLIRFNTSLLIKSGAAAANTANAWVVLD